MSDTFVQQQLCKKLDEFGTLKSAKNTIYRKLVNWDGDSRWTLIYDIFVTLQSAADFVNSQVPADPLVLDSLPARFMLSEKYKKQQEEQAIEALATANVAANSERKKKKKESAATDSAAPAAATTTASKQSTAQEAILVAKNVERVLSMKNLHESLGNVKTAIAQFCNKKRYKNDEIAVALFLSLLNSANRIALRIETFLNELKAM